MADGLPDHLALQAGERPLAVILQDRQVMALREGLIATVLFGGLVALFSIIDLANERPPRGMSGGMLLTFLFLFAPILQQRIFARPMPYVLTDRRLILDEDAAIDLGHIARLRVRLTSVTVCLDGQKLRLVNLVNAPAVAQLIQNAVAKGRV